jgi:hypothetical protein
MRFRRTASIAVCAAAIAAPAALARAVPTKDAFKATINSGSGRMAHAKGTFEIDVTPAPASHGKRGVTLDFRGSGCSRKQQCRLSGTLHGTLTPVFNRFPDGGSMFTVHATGRLGRLGHVTVTGSLHGTGNIARGYETMDVTVSGKSSSLALQSRAGPVRGFTTP